MEGCLQLEMEHEERGSVENVWRLSDEGGGAHEREWRRTRVSLTLDSNASEYQ